MEYKKNNIENYKSYLKLSNNILAIEIIVVYLPMLVWLVCLFTSLVKGAIQAEVIFYLWFLLIPALIIQIPLLIKAYLCKRELGQKGNIILKQAVGIMATIGSALIIVPFFPKATESIVLLMLVTLLVFPLGVQLILFFISLFAVSSTKEKLNKI